jgi:predicted alpha/beta superfamily hydrolase
MRNLTLLLLTFVSCIQLYGQQSEILSTKMKSDLVIGDRITVDSKVLTEERIINVYLPEGYHPDSSQSYPVIYLLDGSKHEDFIHIAGIVQFGTYPWINLLPQSILVGIENVDRKHDFTFPTTNKKDKKDFPTTGGSDKFIRFIKEELKPFIQSNYNTSDTSTLIGQSLGGLLATEILLKDSELFNNYLIVSPSLWWDDQSLLDIELNIQSPKNIYLTVGKEGKVMEDDAHSLRDKLTASENINLSFEFMGKQDHANILHLAVYNGFGAIFKKK